MCKLCMFCSFIAAIILYPSLVYAVSAQADLDAEIIHPLNFNYGQLKKFCREEPQVILCDELVQKLKDEEPSSQEYGEPVSVWLEYGILTGNYQ